MNILHFAPINHSVPNGFRFSVPGLVSAQNRLPGVEACLVNIGDVAKLDYSEVSKFDFEFLPKADRIRDMLKVYRPNIVVFHGVYHTQYLRLASNMLKARVPYVVVPRSSLTSGAQQQKKFKKILGNRLFFQKFIRGAAAIHYLTENEYQTSSDFNHRHFIVGNGVDIPEFSKKHTSYVLRMTFIGRYNVYHKGLDVMMECINSVKDHLFDCNVEIDLYGSNSEGGQDFLKEFIHSNDLEGMCHLHGPIYGPDKQEVLNSTDIFLATSRFEGHPMAVLEAMAHGVPCIVTPGTNVQDVVDNYDAGWCPAFDRADISNAIVHAVQDRSQIIAKGRNARRLAEDRFSWHKIAAMTIEEYQRILSTEK